MHLEGIQLLVVFIGLFLVVLGLIVFGLYCVQSKKDPPWVSEYDDDISKHVHKDWNPYEVLEVNKNPCAETPPTKSQSFPMGHPMGPLQRWNGEEISGEDAMSTDPNGEFVRFEDYEQVVRKQSRTIKRLIEELNCIRNTNP